MTSPTPETAISLDDKWTVERGRILISGTQALARVLLAQGELDRRRGLNSAGYITGYRGSPLGNVDTTLWSIARRLDAANIRFLPGVNEDLAATAIRGTQQLDALPGATKEGVFAAWYGKGPGVDRAGDALKHGNFAGAHRNGGVLLFYGDDHGGKSSSVAHQSEQAMAAALIPSLYPANVGEIIEYGLLGYALSRFSGSWVGLKCVNEIVEQTGTVDIDTAAASHIAPPYGALPPEGVHIRAGEFAPLREEQIVVDYRLPLVQAFVRANRVDRAIFLSSKPALGLVTAGKSFGDTAQALRLLGLDPDRAKLLGISLYKVGCIWPLEPEGIAAFAEGQRTLLVVEEKKSFIELQAAAVLINSSDRPRLVGKRDEDGAPLLSSVLQLEPITIALAIAGRLERLGIADAALRSASERLTRQLAAAQADQVARQLKRSPFFCSGCPHSRSTRIPEGSLSMTGIGCHTMANFVRPEEALAPTHMGGEGANWIGLAPFTGTRHMFQNMGDGTYYHSGLLAIRAAIAAGVNITYKILYNDAVAMTGGQPVDGPLSVAAIAHQVLHEGVREVVVVSDDPDRHRRDPQLPPGLRIEHRDALDTVQRDLRDRPGCTVLIYEQTCAAEKRRRRKRGTYPDPPKRLFIAKAVCEGCGDCSVQSTCVSLAPVETAFGTKRRIDQASCNKDYSCLNGFCPSFITVENATPRQPDPVQVDEERIRRLPDPVPPTLAADGYNVMIAGIGGTGVITAGAIIGMAAHIEGHAVSLFDMTGLAQKNGAVYSHVRIAKEPSHIHAQRLGAGETDLLLAFDLVAAAAPEAAATISQGRTRAIVNRDVSPTADFQFDAAARPDPDDLLAELGAKVGPGAVEAVYAGSIAARMGDEVGANLFLIGVAVQRGALPIVPDAIEQAVRLNGTGVDLNLAAFRLGRLLTAEPEAIIAFLPSQANPIPVTLDEIVSHRSEHLTRYQDAAYAARYRSLVERVRDTEAERVPGSDALARTVARLYAKLLAYKDEYEVARMLTSPELRSELKRSFADGAQLSFNLAPPMLNGRLVNGRPRKRVFSARLMRPALSLLARCKGLRGTPFDPFRRLADRRKERALIAEYEAVVRETLTSLSPSNHDAAIGQLGLADMIRGYGPVKDAAISAYNLQLVKAQADFRAIADGDGHLESQKRAREAPKLSKAGAGSGNRTRVTSLEG